MMNYLQTENGHFVRDVELGFNCHTRCPKSFDWTRYVDSDTIGQQIVSISHIPPSIFLLALLNARSFGFGFFVPLDMCHSEFFERLAAQFSRKDLVGILSSYILKFVDLNYLDEHGAVRYYLSSGKDDPIRGIVKAAEEFWAVVSK